MAASTGPRDGQRKDSKMVAYKMPASTTINKHTLVSARVADGYAYPARSGTSTDIFLGVATASKTSGAVAGADIVQVEKTGSFVFVAAGMAQTDLGASVYASDDQTVTKTALNNQLVGKIVEVISATLVRVRIDAAVN